MGMGTSTLARVACVPVPVRVLVKGNGWMIQPPR